MKHDIQGLIGQTPIIEITKFDAGPCRLFMKLESMNPGGSIKDRAAISMVESAEESGALKPGGLMVEATAGNTGLGLAMIAAIRGYRIILVAPDKMARAKLDHCAGLGAEIIWTRSDVTRGHPEYYIDLAQKIAFDRGGVFMNQFSNPANPRAHETTTGPEIMAQMKSITGSAPDAVVCGVGSGGTMGGLARFFGRESPETKMILADPEGSILAPLVNTGERITPGKWAIEGAGEDFVPDNLDVTKIASAYSISDDESFETTRQLLRLEGVLAGPSSGMNLAAALRYCRAQKTQKNVLTFVCERGEKYLDKLFPARP